MRFSAAYLLSASSLLTSAAPFQPKDTELQRHRRRAVDYPVEFAAAKPLRKLRRRAASPEPYSIVQVDGSSSTTDAAPVSPPDTTTVTQPAGTASTQLVTVTSVIQGPVSDVTVVLTTTQEFPVTSTAMAAPTTVTSEVATTAPAATVTAVSVSTPDFTAQMTVPKTVTTAAEPTASSTSYYDDGLWHTYYPVKSFVPPPYQSSSTISAQAAVATGLGVNDSAPSVAASTAAFRVVKRYEPYPLNTPTPSPVSKWAGHARGYEAAYSPARYPSAATPTPVSNWKRNAGTPTPVAGAGHWAQEAHHEGEAYQPQATPNAPSFPVRARKAPEGLKVTGWNVTRTEERGMRRFKA